jgi:hypothetical protein
MAQAKSQTEKSSSGSKVNPSAGMNGPGFVPNSAIPIPVADTMQFGADSMKHFVEASQDLAQFYNKRFRKDISFMSELGSCNTPAQGAAVWFRAASEAAHDYVDQFDRVMEITLNGSMPE